MARSECLTPLSGKKLRILSTRSFAYSSMKFLFNTAIQFVTWTDQMWNVITTTKQIVSCDNLLDFSSLKYSHISANKTNSISYYYNVSMLLNTFRCIYLWDKFETKFHSIKILHFLSENVFQECTTYRK